jgi:hypothetical protein
MPKEPRLGRPPLPKSERAESQIQLRVSRKRKAAYVRAARPGTLAAWIFTVCDKASDHSE